MSTGATTVARLLLRADERPEDPALVTTTGECLSFADWVNRSNAVAAGLAARGVKPNDRVVLVCESDDWLSYAASYIAVHRLGGVCVPIPRMMGPRHLQLACAATSAVGVIGTGGLPDLPVWSAAPADLTVTPPGPILRPRSAEDDAEILFTSGTTGTPRGIVATHGNLLWTHTAGPLRDRGRVVLHALTPGSAAGQGLLLQPLDAVPHLVVSLSRYDDEEFVNAIHDLGPTHLVIVPALALSLTRSEAASRLDPASVRVVRTISAPIAPATLKALAALFPNAEVFNLYTSTESLPARVKMRYDPRRPTSVGRSSGAGELRIVTDNGARVAATVPGHVELRLAGAPRRRPLDPTASAAFRGDGWVRTGDVGYLDGEGYLYLVDRASDVVNSGGVKLSTIETEATIHAYPDVRDVAAVGLPHPGLGEYLAVAIVPGPRFDLQTFKAFVADTFGAGRAPKRVFIRDALPRNPAGKVDKVALRVELARGDAAPLDAPQSPLFERVRNIWREVLKDPELLPSAHFLAAGGDSLTATTVVARVRAELGRHVSHNDVFDAENLLDFVVRVQSAPESTTTIEPIRRVPRR